MFSSSDKERERERDSVSDMAGGMLCHHGNSGLLACINQQEDPDLKVSSQFVKTGLIYTIMLAYFVTIYIILTYILYIGYYMIGSKI